MNRFAYDKNDIEIEVGSSVMVPEPNDTDLHSNEFNGTVKGFHGIYVVVEDQDGDCFDIKAERLEVI
ncbi:MAG: hypothetical protein LLG04_08665 [Parachlamydia sp.]|nr:hypothetical protein [Parachlamydia sp.]